MYEREHKINSYFFPSVLGTSIEILIMKIRSKCFNKRKILSFLITQKQSIYLVFEGL